MNELKSTELMELQSDSYFSSSYYKSLSAWSKFVDIESNIKQNTSSGSFPSALGLLAIGVVLFVCSTAHQRLVRDDLAESLKVLLEHSCLLEFLKLNFIFTKITNGQPSTVSS